MIQRLMLGDPSYPGSLRALQSPPRELFCLGDLGALADSPGRHVAIVGTRKASMYGLRIAEALGRTLASAGAVVVSGMAEGIDTAAHRGALRAGGKTIAVLGTGVNVPYPARNRGLHTRVVRDGLVVSEQGSGVRAFPGCFPRRNRIIAALARVTIVVEAGFKSGALNTANLATDLGRVVAAVPGEIDVWESMGSNQLLRDGAQVVASVEDAMGLLGLSRNSTVPNPPMGPLEANIWDILGRGSIHPDALADQLDVPARELLSGISHLELLGLVAVGLDGKVGRSAALRATTTMLREPRSAYASRGSRTKRATKRAAKAVR